MSRISMSLDFIFGADIRCEFPVQYLQLHVEPTVRTVTALALMIHCGTQPATDLVWLDIAALIQQSGDERKMKCNYKLYRA